MPGADFLDLGNWNANCAKCGFKYKASELIKEAAGAGLSAMWVCRKCWRPRQPQEFVRGIPEKPQAPWVQKFPETYVTNFCDLYGISAVVGYAVVDCSTVEMVYTGSDPLPDEFDYLTTDADDGLLADTTTIDIELIP